MESCGVLAVRYATRNTRLSEVYLNHHTYGEPDSPIAMDYYFWVIRGGEATVVVDTGFKPSVGKAGGRRVICPVPDALSPGVTAIEVGGYTPGQMMVLVEGDPRSVLLMSEVVHYYNELRRDRPFHVVADLPAMYRAFDTIRAMDRDESLVLIPGHDPLVIEAFAPLDEMKPNLGARIML